MFIINLYHRGPYLGVAGAKVYFNAFLMSVFKHQPEKGWQIMTFISDIWFDFYCLCNVYHLASYSSNNGESLGGFLHNHEQAAPGDQGQDDDGGDSHLDSSFGYQHCTFAGVEQIYL